MAPHTAAGPRLFFSDRIHAEKYRLPGEDFEEANARLCSALKDGMQHEAKILDITRDMRFMPAGRVQAAMGSPKSVTPYNCFVSGTIDDSFVDGNGSIMARAREAAQTMRMGGGIGYDFSNIRPNGELIRSLMSTASGPLSFMDIFDAVCKCVQSSGHRRGAQMGVLRIDHPDVEEFVTAKQDLGRLTGFNLSLAVTDEFMLALKAGERSFDLRFEGRTVRTVNPQVLWEQVMEATWDWAEPGVLFIDTINRMNNLWYCETIAATNPCGEQPLPPFGACLLGSFNLARYVFRTFDRFGFDFDQLRADVAPVVRMMDNVVDRAIYPLEQQRHEAHSKRRMGLGITALANAGEALGHPYGSPGFLEFERQVLTIIRDESYRASVELAREKGHFDLYDSRYLEGQFVATLPRDLQEDIRAYGIRNSHLTSIAPTGTISLAADNVSSSIEPVFEYEATRVVNMPEGTIQVDLSDYGFREFGVRGKQSHQVTAEEHLAVLSVASSLVDSAVSKTCNVDGSMPWSDFKGIYEKAWENGCKGCTTFNKDGKRMGILLGRKPEPVVDENASCQWDPVSGRKSCE